MSDAEPTDDRPDWELITWAIPEDFSRLGREFREIRDAALREIDPNFGYSLFGGIVISDPRFVTKAQEIAFVTLGIPFHHGPWEEYRDAALSHEGGYEPGTVIP